MPQRVKNYLKSLKFRFFILLLIFGIIPGMVLRAGVIYTYENYVADKQATAEIIKEDLLSNLDVEESFLAEELEKVGSDAGLVYLKRVMTLLQIILFTAVILFGFLLSGRLIRPFKKLTASIQAVQEGYQSHFEPVDTYTETAQMSEACSDMLGRLKRLDDSREEFVANVSHELKTPLASMKVLSDSLIGQENVPNEIYRDFMKDIAGEIDRENSIINDLLSLVRLNTDSVELDITNVSINDMMDLLMKRLRPIAEQHEVELLLESFRPVTAEVDEGKLTLAFSNLIENGIKYNRPGGFVHVTLNADHENFFVNVIDNGIGIPEDSLDHIFDRFYRVDKSHSRKIGGTGLGLAITRSVIVMHHGAIRVHSEENEGTTFTVRIPLYAEEGVD